MFYYAVNSGSETVDGKIHTMYGITVLCGEEEIERRSGVSIRRDTVESVVRLFNENKLDPIHLDDVLEDIIS